MADGLFVALGLALIFTLAAGANAADLNDDTNLEIADGIAVYLGVMPAAIVRGHAESHPEATMHVIDSAVRALIDSAFQGVVAILKQQRRFDRAVVSLAFLNASSSNSFQRGGTFLHHVEGNNVLAL